MQHVYFLPYIYPAYCPSYFHFSRVKVCYQGENNKPYIVFPPADLNMLYAALFNSTKVIKK